MIFFYTKLSNQEHFCLCLHARVWLLLIFHLEHVKTKEITVKLLNKVIKHALRNTTCNNADFTSPCNINIFNGIENGGLMRN